jgi:molecular chaperone GrpE|tara:strand:- start:340 stop:948 length:609 start_codon:yes stop_codon:yes gene_type:complete
MSKSDKKEEKPLSENHNQKVNENNKDLKDSPENKLKSTEEKLLRTLAEMENQRRRFEKEREEAFEFGGFNFARESLSLIDNIDRAIESFKNDEKMKKYTDLHKIIDGIEIVKKDLISIFKKNGIDPINCINEKFDPNFHQAMLEIENSNKEPGTVVQEIQKGYMMKNRLLRPSLVGVAKKKEEKTNKTTKDDEKIEKKDQKK